MYVTEGACGQNEICTKRIVARTPSTTSWSPSLAEGGFGGMLFFVR